MNKLTELRIERDLTQTELAKIMNVARNTVSQWESSKREPDIKTLIKLADFYNVSLDHLCSREYQNSIGNVQEDRKETLQQINEMSDSNFALVKGYVNGILISQQQKQNILRSFNN